MPTIDTADLVVDYAEHGEGPAVLLVHGWPDDASTWDGVVPAIHASGRRVIVPTLRGFGGTRFRDGASSRTGNSGIHHMDLIALADALGVERFAVAGHDSGSNIAEALAVGWPERVERIAMLSTPPRLSGMPTPPFAQAQLYWYHWFMATARGEQAVRSDPRGFARVHWENWSPPSWFDEATFQHVARSFDNPDWVDVTLHSYRARWENASYDPRSEWLETRIKATKTLSLPTLFIKGDADGVTLQESFASVPSKFDGPFELVGLPGVGHFPTREAPARVAELLVDFLNGERPR